MYQQFKFFSTEVYYFQEIIKKIFGHGKMIGTQTLPLSLSLHVYKIYKDTSGKIFQINVF